MKKRMNKNLANTIYSVIAGAVCLAFIASFLLWQHHHLSKVQSAEFEVLADQKNQELQTTLNRYEESLRLTANSISAYGLGQLNQARFRAYVDSLDLRKQFPGALGMAFIRKSAVERRSHFCQEYAHE